jgi:hypothetical protein
MRSLRRTLAVRFSLTMLVALALIALWAVVAGRVVLHENLLATGIGPGPAAAALARATTTLLILMSMTVLLATICTMFGAGWLARSATQPAVEIAEQAAAVVPGVTGQRITAHAEVTEFTALVRVLNGMLERLDLGVESQRRLLADAGHDLRTPITAMRGELEVALRAPRTADQYRDTLKSVLDEVDRLSAISESLLILGQLDAGSLRPRSAPVDLAGLVEEALRRWRGRLGDRTVTVVARTDLPPVAADARLVRVAVDQVFENLSRHTPDGTTATAALEAGNGQIRLAVEDNGPGQSPDVLAHLFDRFYRADPARSGHGAGLGLTLVAAVAVAHGGKAWAEPGTAGGLRVLFTLPAAGPVDDKTG